MAKYSPLKLLMAKHSPLNFLWRSIAL
jgi:hypothetical protein